MNNIIVTHLFDDDTHYIKICNRLSCMGYKVLLINYKSYFIKEPIDKNVTIKTYFSERELYDNQLKLRKFLLNRNFDIIFVEHFYDSYSEIFENIPSEIYFDHFLKPHKSYYEIYNVIDFEKISYDSFMLKYIRNQKLKTILKNE